MRDEDPFLADGSGSSGEEASNGADGTTTSGSAGGPTTAGTDDDGVRLDVGPPGATAGAGDEGGDCEVGPPPGDATISGTVYAPNGQLPISGALVWVDVDPPEGVPDHVYCEECVGLPCESHFTLTDADGTFSLDAPSGVQHVMVQKGQFLRATEVDVPAGPSDLPKQATTLPRSRKAGEGKWAPNIALAWGDYDELENGLAKLGLADVSQGSFVGGTERFDVYDNSQSGSWAQNPLDTAPLGSFADLLSDPELLAQYHIIFIPCTSSPHSGLLNDPAILANIREWVAAGGKWYVADWSNEFIEKPFPQYQSWWKDAFLGGMDLDEFDTFAKVLDEDLLAWLGALPAEFANINAQNPGNAHPTLNDLPRMELVDLWSTLKNVPPVLVDDGIGGQVDVGHKVWLEGPGGGGDGAPAGQDWPLTVTGEYGCGKILFTSYHTVEWDEPYNGLTPQELVLMYLILEIGVCQTPHDPPRPEG